mgnify:CR=1 FL=1
MKASYFELISGSDLFYDLKFHIRQIRLKELIQDGCMGERIFYTNLSIIKLKKEDFIHNIERSMIIEKRILDKLKNETITLFDLLLIFPDAYSLFLDAFKYFIVEKMLFR